MKSVSLHIVSIMAKADFPDRPIGCLVGAVFILGAGDWLGRRWSILLGALVMILGVIIQVTAEV